MWEGHGSGTRTSEGKPILDVLQIKTERPE